MAVDNISGVRTYTSNGYVVEPASTDAGVSQTDFLRLMTTQLQNQDPFNPVDGQEMIVQMAQISNSTGIAEMNLTLKQISEQLADQADLLAALKGDTGATDTTGTDTATDTGTVTDTDTSTDTDTNIPA